MALAGGLGEPVGLLELAPDRWRDAINLNLTSAFDTMQVFLPGMVARRRGAMVTVSSTAGRQAATLLGAPRSQDGGRSGGAASPAYAAAKAGLLALTRHAAAEVAQAGVRVNAVAPGAILNERMAQAPPDVLAKVAGVHPLGRAHRTAGGRGRRGAVPAQRRVQLDHRGHAGHQRRARHGVRGRSGSGIAWHPVTCSNGRLHRRGAKAGPALTGLRTSTFATLVMLAVQVTPGVR